MTIGEYIRSHGDFELSVILFNWMATLVTIMGGNVNQLALKDEFFAVTEYVQSPMTPELEAIIKLWSEPSELTS